MSVLSIPFSGETFSLPTNERKLSESSLRYAAVLAVASLFLMLEGAIRFTSYKAAAPPTEISSLESRAITGGSFEIFFGGVGFLLGISVLNFDFHWRDFTAVTLLVEVVMGVFVFAVFTLEIPMHWGRMHGKIGVVGSHSYPLDSFSHYESNVALVFGYILGSISLCAMLHTLQLVCTAGLLCVQAESTPLSSRQLKAFSIWTIFLVFLYGLSTLVFGVLVFEEVGPGLIKGGGFVFPPHVVTYASHTITSGVLVTVLAGLLAGSLVAHEKMAPFTCAWATLTWIWLLTGGVMTQVSLAAASSSELSSESSVDSSGLAWAGPAAQMVGLLTVLVFGPLFVLGELRRERRHEEEANVSTQGELEFRSDVMKLSGDKQYDGARGSVGGL